jgi:23S rRNA (cytosine1962-C5)-methyltransferase
MNEPGVIKSEYALLDSGGGEKLERFGKYVLIRPEPGAHWPRTLDAQSWNDLAHARFVKSGKDAGSARGGEWKKIKQLPADWPVDFDAGQQSIKLMVKPGPFGHVGVFPEQLHNWKFIASQLQSIKDAETKVLNLFAYTGGASIVARAAGADVVHVDASKPVISQARRNMELNQLDGIRWVHEDVFRFVLREVKRGNKYHGIILDPPPSGKGPSGERWNLEKQLPELLKACSRLLSGQQSFVVMSLYAIGATPDMNEKYLKQAFNKRHIDAGYLVLKPLYGTSNLPQGTYSRLGL